MQRLYVKRGFYVVSPTYFLLYTTTLKSQLSSCQSLDFRIRSFDLKEIQSYSHDLKKIIIKERKKAITI